MLILLKFLKFRQMFTHFRKGNPFTIAAVIPHRQRNEMITHNTANIQIIVQILQSLILKKFMFGVSHGLSGIRRLSPYE